MGAVGWGSMETLATHGEWHINKHSPREYVIQLSGFLVHLLWFFFKFVGASGFHAGLKIDSVGLLGREFGRLTKIRGG